ncbi:MAG: leucine-rich repeat domain-containing protein [Simkaniaceae bacterium]|nr:leucine-rich repeat domain-containing protein [Simkaniaceae bacterium]
MWWYEKDPEDSNPLAGRKIFTASWGDSKKDRMDLARKMIRLHLQVTQNPDLFSTMRELRIATKHLTELPSSINQLRGLQILKLSGCNLEVLPSAIGDLIALKKLRLDENRLTSLPLEIRQLTALTYLDLACNRLVTIDYPVMARISKIASIILFPQRCGYTHRMYRDVTLYTHFQIACLSVEQRYSSQRILACMHELNIVRGCDAREKAMICYNQSHPALPTKWDKASENDLHRIDVQSLYQACVGPILLNTAVKTPLAILFGEVVDQLSHFLPANDPCLQDAFSLMYEQEIRMWMKEQQSVLSRITSLQFVCSEMEFLPPEVSYLTGVTQLWCVGIQLQRLPPEIGQLTKLRELALCDNCLKEVPLEISALTALEFLDLDGNALTHIPAEIGSLSHLKKLCLLDNPLISLPYSVAMQPVQIDPEDPENIYIKTCLNIAALSPFEHHSLETLFSCMEPCLRVLGMNFRQEVIVEYNQTHAPLPTEWNTMDARVTYTVDVEGLYHAYITIIERQRQRDKALLSLFETVRCSWNKTCEDLVGFVDEEVPLAEKAQRIRFWIETNRGVLDKNLIPNYLGTYAQIETIEKGKTHPLKTFFLSMHGLNIALGRDIRKEVMIRYNPTLPAEWDEKWMDTSYEIDVDRLLEVYVEVVVLELLKMGK